MADTGNRRGNRTNRQRLARHVQRRAGLPYQTVVQRLEALGASRTDDEDELVRRVLAADTTTPDEAAEAAAGIAGGQGGAASVDDMRFRIRIRDEIGATDDVVAGAELPPAIREQLRRRVEAGAAPVAAQKPWDPDDAGSVYLAWPEDGVACRRRDGTPATLRFRRLLGWFVPMVWIPAGPRPDDEHAVIVRPQGPQEWDATAFVLERWDAYDREGLLAKLVERGYGVDAADALVGDPSAPAWARDWRGPFDAEVHVDTVEYGR